MIISVVAKPNSSVDKIEIKSGVLHVKIKAQPVDGEANQYLIKFLSKTFGISQSKIDLVKGHTSKNKLISLDVPQLEYENVLTKLFASSSFN